MSSEKKKKNTKKNDKKKFLDYIKTKSECKKCKKDGVSIMEFMIHNLIRYSIVYERRTIPE